MKKYNHWNTIKRKKNRPNKTINNNITMPDNNNNIIYKNRFDISDEDQMLVSNKNETVYNKSEKGKELLKNIIFFSDSPKYFI